MTLRPLIAATLVLATAACAAQIPWRNPNRPKEQWSRDWNGCKRQSDAGMSAFHSDDGGSSPLRDYDRAQTKRQIDAELSMCMRELGYTPISKSED